MFSGLSNVLFNIALNVIRHMKCLLPIHTRTMGRFIHHPWYDLKGKGKGKRKGKGEGKGEGKG